MKIMRLQSVSLVWPLALVTLALSPASEPRFTPIDGASIERTLEMKGTRELKSLVMKFGDQSEEVPDAKIHVDLGWKYVVVDEFKKCKADHIDALTRTFESLEKKRSELSTDAKGAEKKRAVEEECDLEGKSVDFKWNAERKEYDVKFAGEEAGDKELLTGLELDMDYRGFLPEAGAEVGAKWNVDFADLKGALMRPGGDLPFHLEQPPRPMDLRMRDAVWDANQGTVALELGAVTEADGAQLQKILFKGTNTVSASVDAEADEPGPTKLALEDELTIEGTLVWDVKAGRAHSLEWSSKGGMVLTVYLPAKGPDGEKATIEQVFTFDTEYDYTGTFKSR
ncbi:MAG: hypothetical protein JNL28_07070 [Planctomycetes bacterium]|nr:hypothetical protein [Planctomycetota bacterium]